MSGAHGRAALDPARSELGEAPLLLAPVDGEPSDEPADDQPDDAVGRPDEARVRSQIYAEIHATTPPPPVGPAPAPPRRAAAPSRDAAVSRCASPSNAWRRTSARSRPPSPACAREQPH